MRPHTLARLAALVGTLTACSDFPTRPTADFAAAWQRWQRSQPADYRYDVQVLCFCGPERTRTVHAVVSGGQTVSFFYADSGNAADTVLFSDVRTMDRLFATLQAALDRHPYRFVAAFDPNLGYPVSVDIDVDAQIVDEEVSYRISNFSPLLRAVGSETVPPARR